MSTEVCARKRTEMSIWTERRMEVCSQKREEMTERRTEVYSKPQVGRLKGPKPVVKIWVPPLTGYKTPNQKDAATL